MEYVVKTANYYIRITFEKRIHANYLILYVILRIDPSSLRYSHLSMTNENHFNLYAKDLQH